MMFRHLTGLSLVASAVASSIHEEADRALRGLSPVGDDCSFPGNGFPKGKGLKAAFRLKLLGRDLDKKETWNFNPKGDNSIAIALNGRTKIILENSQESGTDCFDQCQDDFCVADPNGTDSDGATLCLKDPFPEWDVPCIPGVDERSCDEEATFRIFARVRGQGSIDFTSCFDDLAGEVDTYCDTGNTVTVSGRKARDISQSLLTICYDGAGIGLFDQLCFDDEGSLIQCNDDDAGGIDEQYFWQVDNDGVRNAELRFFDQDDLDDLFEGTGCTWDAVTRGNAC